MVDYKIEDIKVFVDGIELDGIAPGTGFSPEEGDKVAMIKDWSKRTVALAKTRINDASGSICLTPTSESNSVLGGFAKSSKSVTVVIVSLSTAATVWKKISCDECVFSNPDVKPTAEGEVLEWRFKGYNFSIEW